MLACALGFTYACKSPALSQAMQNALPVPLAMFSPWILVSCKQDDSVGMKQRGDQCV